MKSKEIKETEVIIDRVSDTLPIQEYIKENYILKKYIRNKIKELKNEINLWKFEYDCPADVQKNKIKRIKAQIQVLEELLLEE